MLKILYMNPLLRVFVFFLLSPIFLGLILEYLLPGYFDFSFPFFISVGFQLQVFSSSKFDFWGNILFIWEYCLLPPEDSPPRKQSW